MSVEGGFLADFGSSRDNFLIKLIKICCSRKTGACSKA
jgi:hypothetical protein